MFLMWGDFMIWKRRKLDKGDGEVDTEGKTLKDI